MNTTASHIQGFGDDGGAPGLKLSGSRPATGLDVMMTDAGPARRLGRLAKDPPPFPDFDA